jgi:hypothetical protein
MRRHRVDEAEVVILDVQVPRHWLRRAWRGLWTCQRIIPPARLQLLAAEDSTPSLQLS